MDGKAVNDKNVELLAGSCSGRVPLAVRSWCLSYQGRDSDDERELSLIREDA